MKILFDAPRPLTDRIAIGRAEFEVPAPRSLEGEALYCPLCGARVWFDTAVEPCAHLVYAYDDELGEAFWAAEDRAQLIERAVHAWWHEDEDDGDERRIVFPRDRYEHVTDLIAEVLASRYLLTLSATTRGFACGPSCSTLHLAFDFSRS